MIDVTKLTDTELADALAALKVVPAMRADILSEAQIRLRAMDEPVDVTEGRLVYQFEELVLKGSCIPPHIMFSRLPDGAYKMQGTFSGYAGFVLGYKAAVEALGRKVKV